MSTAKTLDTTSPRKKACLKGFSPDGAELRICNNGEFEIAGGDPKNYNTLVRLAKTYLAIIKANGYDISNLTQEEFSDINSIIKELKSQNNA